MRKLVTIRRIGRLEPIPNADLIELAHVDGWQCVVKKGEFEENDLCAYFEIDSLLPIEPQYEFLRKSSYKKFADGSEGFRIKTVRLKGQLAQGLALPLKAVFHGFDREVAYQNIADYERGLEPDLTELLGVKKFEPAIPAVLSGDARGNFPHFIRKTDQDRIQNLFGKLSRTNATDQFEVTLKMDGSSMTVYYHDGVFGVCSRNLDLEENEDNTFWRTARKANLELILQEYRNLTQQEIAVQGELVGPGIQGNREGLADFKMFVYGLWNITEQRRATPRERTAFWDWAKQFGPNEVLDHVPVLGTVYPFEMFSDVQSILAYAEGHSLNNPVREGLVFNSVNDGDLSFKAISNRYLLAEES